MRVIGRLIVGGWDYGAHECPRRTPPTSIQTLRHRQAFGTNGVFDYRGVLLRITVWGS